MLDIMLYIIGRKVTIKGINMQLKRQENECISCFCLYLCSVIYNHLIMGKINCIGNFDFRRRCSRNECRYPRCYACRG